MMHWFVAVVAFVGLQRLVELAVSRRNIQRLLDRGGRLIEDDGYRLIIAVHVGWFASMILERGLSPWAGVYEATLGLLGVYVLAEALRLWAITTLGDRWTTRVVVVDEPKIENGPYQWLSHPNYVAVSIELVALPAAFGLWVTAGLVAIANAVALARRIRREDAAWEKATRGGA